MDINDSNAERRNLTLLSLSIIIFYMADGSFVDGDITLQVINIHFNNPEFLFVFVWGMLLWFLLRYWQVNQGEWVEPYYDELDYLPKFWVKKYLVMRFKREGKYKQSVHGKQEYFGFYHQNGAHLEFQEIYYDSGVQRQEYIEIKTLSDKLFMLVAMIYLFFRKPTLSSYFVPYILFIIACVLGCFDYINTNFPAAS